VSDASLLASARRKVAPQYPAAARSARVEGPVVVEVQIDGAGRVTSARALSGPAMLRDAAASAARQWSFAPQDAAGGKVTIVGTIAFNFKL
jgi:protein TonB